MILEEIDATKYEKLFPECLFPYNSVAYNLINKSKCSKLKFLVFQEGKTKIGLIGGIVKDSFLAPFSAPFTTFSFSVSPVSTEKICKAISVLEEYLIENKINKIQIKIPPVFYDPSLISKTIFSFYHHNYSFIVDENHFFYTIDFKAYEENNISKGVRYNLKIAENTGLIFRKANTMDECFHAYKVLEVHSDWKKFQLKMSFEQFDEMRKFLKIDYFLVYRSEIPVAASVVYNYSPEYVHILYWGNIPESNNSYPMNFLAKNIFRFYKDQNVKIIDLAISSILGVPYFGMSAFKDTIGCKASLRYTFKKNLYQNKTY